MLPIKQKEVRTNKSFFITKFIFIVFISALAAITVFSDTSSARDTNSVDVVLVIDSSGSMKKTDPLSLRIPAAKMFISLLDKDDRAAVVSFSGQSSTMINLTPVDTEENKTKLFEAADKITSDGLLTNLHDALRTGLDILSKNKESERSKIIVLMSDGMMDVGDPQEDKRLAKRSKANLAVALKDNGIKVFTIAFTEQSDIKLLEKISKRTAGFHNLALTDSEFHLIFTSIFESLKTPEMLPMSSNGFLVDASVEEVTIVATKDAPDIRIHIDSPEGQSYTYKNKGTGIKWFVSNNFDMITIKEPAQGRWEILFSAGENNKAYIISNLKLRSDFNQMYATFGKPVNVKMWLEKEGATINEKDILDKINVYIELTTPDGKTMELKPHTNGNGIFYKKIASFTAGNYKLKLVAKGMTFERQKRFVFNVASTKEAKEEIKFKETEKKIREEMQSESKGHHETDVHPEKSNHEEDEESDETSWMSFLIQLLVFNLIIGIVWLLYIKREKLKNLKSLSNIMNVLKNVLKIEKLLSLIKKKEENQEETGSEEAPEAQQSESKTEPEPEPEPEPQQEATEKEIQDEEESSEVSETNEPQQEATSEETGETPVEQESIEVPKPAEPKQEATPEATEETPVEQESIEVPKPAEPQQEAAEEEIKENQAKYKNEIALDELDTEEETEGKPDNA